MEAVFYLVLVLLAIYPYWLIVRFLRLGCKAFKKYLRKEYTIEQPIYEDYEEQ